MSALAQRHAYFLPLAGAAFAGADEDDSDAAFFAAAMTLRFVLTLMPVFLVPSRVYPSMVAKVLFFCAPKSSD